MEMFDAVFLARLQFAFTVGAHIIFPATSIGLASYLTVLNGLSLFTGRQVYLDLFNYWKAIFVIPFGMGVVSGVVMTYQFGTNWSVYADKTGPVLGPLMGYEVLSAFFLEAGFLGIMLFGRERVGPRLHFFATLMVGAGTLFSAFWILAVNSWMQTPAGHSVNAAGQFVVVSWWDVIFNPSFPTRLIHMVLAAYLTTAFVVGAVGALHLLRDNKNPRTRIMFSMAMWMAALVTPLQMLAGDASGLITLKHQPAKLAAIEGHFKTTGPADEILIGWPNEKEKRVDYAVSVPYLGSIILTHSLDGKVPGVDDYPNASPPMIPIFFTFRIMVGIGLLMLCLGFWSLWARYKKRLYTWPLMLKAAVIMGPAGYIAVLCGWITTEVGRQPFTVYGLLRTVDSASPIDYGAVATSLFFFVVIYLTVFGIGIYYTLRLMNKPPTGHDTLSSDSPVHAAGIMPGPHMNHPRDLHNEKRS